MEEQHQRKYHESRAPRFFKIILHDTLQTGMLSLPRCFVRKYGRGLCLNKAYLKVASGDTWEVELHKEEDGGMRLLDGWQDFVEFYNIKCGHLLVFCYLENSEFQVLIFNKTASEIKYPRKPRNTKEQNDDVDPCLEVEETDDEMLVDHDASKNNSHDESTDCMGKGSRDYEYVKGELGTSKRLTPNKYNEHPEAILRTRRFNSRNPFFRMIMRSTYVTDRFVLHLPGRYIMDHIGQKNCYMKLSVPDGRSWDVKGCFKMRGNLPEAKFQSSWKTFVKDNNLVVGDVCVFELIDTVKVHFRVTIFKVSVDRNSSPHPVESESRECNGKQASLKPPCHEASSSDIQDAITSGHTSKNPSFKLVMTEARMKSMKAPIQAGFLKHLKPTAQIATLKVAGRFWRVRVCFYNRRPGGEAEFSRGWRKFATGNRLEVGDICVFELIEREKMVFKVSIHNGST